MKPTVLSFCFQNENRWQINPETYTLYGLSLEKNLDFL